VDVFHFDRGFVHEDADRESQATERHDVDRLSREPEGQDREAERQRDVEHHDDRASPVSQEDEHCDADEHRPERALDDHRLHRPRDVGRLVELEAHLDIGRQHTLHLGDGLLDVGDHAHRGGVGTLGRQDVDGPPPVGERIAGRCVGGVGDGGDIPHVHGRPTRADRDREERLRVADDRVDGDDRIAVADQQIARWADRVALRHGLDDLVRRHAVGLQPLRIDRDHDRAGTAAEGRRGGDARQCGEHRSHPKQRDVLDLRDRSGLAREHEVAHRHAAGVEPHHERRDGAGRHEGLRPVDVVDRLRHRLGHVRARMEEELHQGRALHVSRLHVVDAADVEEVVLVVVGEEALHLRRVHAAVGLADVDHGQIEAREDVNFHAPREAGGIGEPELLADRSAHGQKAAQGDRQHHDHHGQRPPQGCGDDELHAAEKPLNEREQRISGLPSLAQLPELPARVV